MNQVTQTTPAHVRLRAAVGGVVATFSLFAASLVVPLAGFISGVLAPFPVAHTRIIHGRGAACIAFAGGLTAITGLFGVNAGIVYLLQCGTIALLMPELILRGQGPSRTILWTTASSLGLVSCALAVYVATGGHDLHRAAANEINASITQAVSLYEKSGVTGDDLAALKKTMGQISVLFLRIYPALATLIIAMVASVNLLLVQRFTLTRTEPPREIPALSSFRLKDALIWVLIASGFAMLASSPLVTTPALNILILVCSLYFIQGLAVVLTITARQTFGGFFRIFFWMMLVFQPYLAALVAAIGIFDLWADFRTPKTQENL